MHVIATYSRNAQAAGGVRLRAPRLAARRTPRRTALTIALALLVLLLLAAEAQAYVPGQLLWAGRIGTSTSGAGAWAVAAGPNGATAIAGWKHVASTGQTPMVARYNAAGTKWIRTLASPGYAEAVAFDNDGNVYVAATINPSAGGDIAVSKYSASGVWQWTQTYDGGGTYDSAQEMAVDPSGNVVVVGTGNVGTGTGIVVLKYDATGTMAWPAAARYDPPADPDAGSRYVGDLALDAAGDIYLVGSSETRVGGVWVQSAMVLKFAGVDGARTGGWLYEPLHAPDSSFDGVSVRGSAVVAVGETFDLAGVTAGDALVVKFDRSLVQQSQNEWGAGNATGEWFGDVVLDGRGNVFVTGSQWLSGTRGYERAVTMKLNASLSKVLWKATYLPKSRDAEGWYIARDGLGSIFVGGIKDVAGGLEDFLTIKYSPAGKLTWLRTWSGGGPEDDDPAGLVLGTKSGVYIGGHVTGKGDSSQAVLLKYRR